MLNMLFRTAAAVIWVALAGNSQAEPGELAGVAYEELIRGETNAGEATPLLVAFHYSGGSATESFEHYDQISGPVRILVPLGAYPKRNGLSYFPVDYYRRPPDEQFRIARETAARLAAFLEAAEARYGRKPVVSGISQGGDISLLLAIYHPQTVAAAAPLAAVIPDSLEVTPARALAGGPCILLMQGEADAIVEVSRTRALAAPLQADLPLRLITYPDVGHDISPEMEADYTAFIDRSLNPPDHPGSRSCAFPR